MSNIAFKLNKVSSALTSKRLYRASVQSAGVAGHEELAAVFVGLVSFAVFLGAILCIAAYSELIAKASNTIWIGAACSVLPFLLLNRNEHERRSHNG